MKLRNVNKFWLVILIISAFWVVYGSIYLATNSGFCHTDELVYKYNTLNQSIVEQDVLKIREYLASLPPSVYIPAFYKNNDGTYSTNLYATNNQSLIIPNNVPLVYVGVDANDLSDDRFKGVIVVGFTGAIGVKSLIFLKHEGK